ncbi:hypothetical protein Tco_0138413 [Tanacetum coccineum]
MSCTATITAMKSSAQLARNASAEWNTKSSASLHVMSVDFPFPYYVIIYYTLEGKRESQTLIKAHLLEDKQIPKHGDDVAGIKHRRRDLSSDGVRNLAMTSGGGRFKEDLEPSTWQRNLDDDSNVGEVLKELEEHGSAGNLCRKKVINNFDGDDLAF